MPRSSEKIYRSDFLFELCQEYLNFFEDNADKLFDDVTWKTGEHIDHIWKNTIVVDSIILML